MRKFFSLFAALTLSVGLWAQGSVFTYTATEKLESQFNNLGTVATHDFNDGVGTVTFDGELTSIPDMAFAGCGGLISIELPESVTEIGGFLMCMNLRDVIAANVRTIGNDAFSGCNNLQSIDLSNVTTIGTTAFNYCLNLQSVFMPNVEEIGSTAFNSCQNLQSVTMPNVTTIESYTFAYCGNLQSIDLSNVTTIGNNAFQWCGLQSVTVPATLTEIGENAFVDCQQLQSVTFLGNSCTIIENAFSGVGNGTPATLILPDSWTGSTPDAEGNWYGGKFAVPAKVGDQFTDATSGLKFEVTSLDPKAVKVIANSYEGTSYNVPATVSYLDETFAITEIGEKAFYECTSLKSITFPASIQQIGEEAFAECNQLRSITCKASLPPECPTSAFWSGVIRDMPLYVPAFSVEAYQESEPWGSLFEIRALPLEVGDQFIDEDSGLKVEVTSVDPKTVKVIANNYSNTSYNVPATASYLDETFAVTEIGEKAFFGCTALQSVTFLGNACQNAIGEDAFSGVGNPDPALLTLPDNWTGTLPDEDGNWYGGKFELSSIPGLTTYLDENGEEQEIVAAEVENASATVTWGTAGNTTWYIVKGTDVQLSKGAICAGDVRFILADGAKLTATGESWQSGIKVSGDGNSLTIYGQTAQSGQLIAKGGSSGAGIGGGYKQDGSNIIINGGIVTATGGGEASGIGGGSSYNSSTTIQGSNITINAGTVTATGGLYAAGIGGGNRGSGSNITINGGIVKATGANSGSGIGGGNQGHGSNITINGGTVEATGGSSGAGIGGGYKGGKGFDITIKGGVVTANGGNHAAGIGGGNKGIGYNITISGGTVTAIGGTDIAGIGIGESATVAASNIYISDAYILKAGAEADPTAVIEHSSATDLASTLTQQYVQFGGLATPYTRTVTANLWGTVCLPYAATSFEGATFYKLNYYNGSDKLYIEEVSTLEAGMPYIFHTTATTVTINHNATAPEAVTAGNENGLYGSFARKTIAYDAEHAFAALANNTVNVIEAGHTVTVPACRAYFDMTKVPTTEQPHSAPLRCIGVPRQTPTSLDKTLDTKHQTQKLLHNGQFVIIRDGKTYNAQGQIIQ